MRSVRIIISSYFLFNIFLNCLSAQEGNVKILSSSRELSFHSEEEESKYWLVTYESALRVSASGTAKLVVFCRINIPLEKTTLSQVPLIVQQDGLKPKRFVFPEVRESTGIYLGEVSFFPSKVFKLTLDVPEGEHIFNFSIPRAAQTSVALRFELSSKDKKTISVEKKIAFSPFVLGGGVSDSYGKQLSGISGLGMGLDKPFTDLLFLTICGKFSLYPEEYHFFTPANEEKIQSGAEYLLNVHGFIGFQVVNGNVFTFSPLAGLYGNAFILGDATNILLGPSAGLQAGVRIFDKSELKLRAVYTYDLLKESVEKPVGGFPFASLSYSITMGISRIFSGYSGEYLMFPRMERIDESGNVMRFDVNQRFYHSLILGYTF
jgi:hypothetical protein